MSNHMYKIGHINILIMLKNYFYYIYISLILNYNLPRVSKKIFARTNLFGKQTRMSKHIKNGQANFNLPHRLWKLIKCILFFFLRSQVSLIIYLFRNYDFY